jgi:hypothetical protein
MHKNYKFGIISLFAISTIQVIFLIIIRIHPTAEIMIPLYGTMIWSLACLTTKINNRWQTMIASGNVFLFSILPKTLIDIPLSLVKFDSHKNSITYFVYLILFIIFFIIIRRKDIAKTQYLVLYGSNFIYLVAFSTSLYSNSNIASNCEYRPNSNNIVTNKINKSINENKSVYVILSDGYPSTNSIQNNLGIRDSMYINHLKNKGFIEYENNNNPTSTPISIAQKFFDVQWKNPKYEFNYFDATYLNEVIIPKSMIYRESQSHNYIFEFNSFLAQNNHTNSKFMSQLWFCSGYNRTFFDEICNMFSYIYLRYYVGSHLPMDELDNGIQSVVSHKFNKREFGFFHLMTFHHSKPFNYKGSDKAFFIEQLSIAQKSIIQVIDIISRNEPTSTIILVSDHGERNAYNNTSSGDGILYIKTDSK